MKRFANGVNALHDRQLATCYIHSRSSSTAVKTGHGQNVSLMKRSNSTELLATGIVSLLLLLLVSQLVLPAS